MGEDGQFCALDELCVVDGVGCCWSGVVRVSYDDLDRDVDGSQIFWGEAGADCGSHGEDAFDAGIAMRFLFVTKGFLNDRVGFFELCDVCDRLFDKITRLAGSVALTFGRVAEGDERIGVIDSTGELDDICAAGGVADGSDAIAVDLIAEDWIGQQFIEDCGEVFGALPDESEALRENLVSRCGVAVMIDGSDDLAVLGEEVS